MVVKGPSPQQRVILALSMGPNSNKFGLLNFLSITPKPLQETPSSSVRITTFVSWTNTLDPSRHPRHLREIHQHQKVGNIKTPIYLVLCGMGGIGKTELAIEYVLSRLDKYDAIF